MADSTEKTVKKNIRVRPQQWERIERAAESGALTANQLVMALAIEALERRERPQTVAESASRGPRCSPPRPSRAISSRLDARRMSRKSANSSRPSCPRSRPNSQH